MDMTSLQCRLARTAVGWSASELAQAAGVSVNTVTKFERGGDARVSTLKALREVLEYAGVEFIPEGASSHSGGEGIRFTPSGISPIERMTAERDEILMQLKRARAELLASEANDRPEVANSVATPFQSALKATMGRNYIRLLEERLQALDRRLTPSG